MLIICFKIYYFCQEFCNPAGMECYNNMTVAYSCLPTCTGLYADINEGSIDIHGGKFTELMKKEYLNYKASFGELIPFIQAESRYFDFNLF